MHEGRYRIVHKLGWGGWSTVWAARDLRFVLSRHPDDYKVVDRSEPSATLL
jgi:hypothetical protein